MDHYDRVWKCKEYVDSTPEYDVLTYYNKSSVNVEIYVTSEFRGSRDAPKRYTRQYQTLNDILDGKGIFRKKIL